MTGSDVFSALIDDLRCGDSEAADFVSRRFMARLISAAHHQIDLWISRKVDAEDVVQSALVSFPRRFNAGGCNFDGRKEVDVAVFVHTFCKRPKQARCDYAREGRPHGLPIRTRDSQC